MTHFRQYPPVHIVKTKNNVTLLNNSLPEKCRELSWLIYQFQNCGYNIISRQIRQFCLQFGDLLAIQIWTEISLIPGLFLYC